MRESHESGARTDVTCAYQARLQSLLDDINADETLNAIDRVHLLNIHAEPVKASLRHARRIVRGDEPVVAPTREGQARKAIRRLCAEGKDPRKMSDSQLLAIGSVGVKTLATIRQILAKQN